MDSFKQNQQDFLTMKTSFLLNVLDKYSKALWLERHAARE